MFKNRSEAGESLGKTLRMHNSSNPVVLAMPRGGVEVAHQAATGLKCSLSVIISRKLKYPLQQCAVFGNLAEDESLYLDPWVKVRLDREMIQKVIYRERNEIQRRIRLYRNGNPIPELSGRTVILIDDKISQGTSIFVAIQCCRKKNPDKIIVAAPAADRRVMEKLTKLADSVIIMDVPEVLYSSDQYYRQHEQLTDQKVIQRLGMWNKGQPDNYFRNTQYAV